MGTNKFFPFPLVLPGASGPQASIDLVGLAPPTGLDPLLTFICTGTFTGVISVEGSIDNVSYSVLTQFESALDADDVAGPELEFSPIAVKAVVRFLRLNVVGEVIDNVGVTVAGESNSVDPDPDFVEANCLPSDAVGNLVYITGPAVAGKYQVATADPSNTSKMPAVGVIISKSSPTDCLIQTEGFITGIYGGLVPGKVYWTGLAGTPVVAPPPSPPNELQTVGVAFDVGTFYLEPDFDPNAGAFDPSKIRDNIRLAGVKNGVNRIFTTPDKYVHVFGGISINVYHNGRKLTESPDRNPQNGDFVAVETGGVGTGFDGIEVLSFVPVPTSELTADYIAV